jgi:putative hydrolase of the HAD superfamily
MLIDLDGVVRRWPSPADLERRYGLPSGAILETAMSWDLLRPAVAGEITDAEWMGLVADRLPLDDRERASEAVAEWQTDRGSVDPSALAFVRDVRAAGKLVGLATNATDRLRGDLDALGLKGEFDVVISSSELHIHKPAPEFYVRACAVLGEPPPLVLFVDDDDRAVRAARALRMPAYRWTGPQDVGYLRKALGIS